jgi:hypothetical protein
MSFLIGGFSPREYQAYLNPAWEPKRKEKATYWISHFTLSRFSTLAVLINRLAYFIFHRCAVYPNNTYLFQKFKSHQFNTIATEEQYRKAKEIFNCFKRCPNLDSNELKRIGEELKEVKKRLKTEKEAPVDHPTISETPKETKEEIDQNSLKASEEDKRSIEERELRAQQEKELQAKLEREAQDREFKAQQEREAREKELKAQQEKELQAKLEREAQERELKAQQEREAREKELKAQQEKELPAKLEKENQEKELPAKLEKDTQEKELPPQQEQDTEVKALSAEQNSEKDETLRKPPLFANVLNGHHLAFGNRGIHPSFLYPYPLNATPGFGFTALSFKFPTREMEKKKQLDAKQEEEAKRALDNQQALEKRKKENENLTSSSEVEAKQLLEPKREEAKSEENAKDQEQKSDSASKEQDLHEPQKDEILDLEKSHPPTSHDLKDQSLSVSKEPSLVLKPVNQKENEPKEEDVANLPYSSSEEDFLSYDDEAEQSEEEVVPEKDLKQTSLEDNTLSRLSGLFEELSHSAHLKDLEVKDKQAKEEAPLAVVAEPEQKYYSVKGDKKVDQILSKPFPLQDSQSLDDLFQGKEAEGIRKEYRTNLEALLRFENKLRVEKLKTDQSFEDYLKKADAAFQKLWTIACGQVPQLHSDFEKAFPSPLPQLLENGEVICTAAQLDWVISIIAQRFPAIYQLAFDAPSFGIYQRLQIALLARSILLGYDIKAPNIPSHCFIHLRETEGKTTSAIEDSSKDNPLTKAGSFIFNHFVSSRGKVTEDPEKSKEQLEAFVAEYVKDWLVRPGTFLQLGDKTIKGGQTTEKIKASDWVTHVRDLYAKTLLSLSKEDLEVEIRHLVTECPLVRLIVETYVDELDEKEWETSYFPAALMDKVFQKELNKAADNRQLYQAIRQTIDDAHFSNSTDIQQLAEKANCSPKLIEPLIRIRVLYMIGCLGQTAIKDVVQGAERRAKTMYDPKVCTSLEDQVLSCQSSEERTLSFDDKFDRLDIKVKVTFKDLNKQLPVAQGQSALHVSSISCSKNENVKTTTIDLENLRFSLYPSKAQRRYLTAQIAPQTLIENMQALASEIASLKLIDKAEQFKKAKEKHEQERSWWNPFARAFNTQPYRTLDQDQENLKQAIRKARTFVAHLNTFEMLSYGDQLNGEQLENFKEYYDQIRNQFAPAFKMLEEIYASADESQQNVIQEKVKQLRELLNAREEQIGVVLSDSEGSSSSGYSSSEEEVLNLEEDPDEEIIGKFAGEAPKPLMTRLWENTLGYLTKETSEVKYLKWKIERYEDLIKGMQQNIVDYIQKAGLGDIPTLIQQAKAKDAPIWLQHLRPVLKLCQKNLRSDGKRLNSDYLSEVRKNYTEKLLGQLRIAANWARNHPDMPGANHVDAICYQLYATLDLNHRCQEVFKTFTALGQSALKGQAEGHALPHDPRYDLIRDLYTAHQQIKAVPNDAKAPLIKQWANSARGHLNGLWGMATFDPNMQSNPMHVLFNKIVKTKDGKGQELTLTVKDIAMGSPTIEVGNGKAEINPEFLGFLRHCKRMGYRHLYINNQNFIPKAWFKGDESVRCQALHDLAENEFKDTLFVITLSQNSSFYEQAGHHLSSLDARKTKDEVISQLLGKSKEMRNYLPSELVHQRPFCDWMAQEIDRLHREEFNNCVAFEDEKTRESFVQRFHDQLRQHVEQLPEGKNLGYSIYHPSTAKFKDEMIAQMFDRSRHETGNYLPSHLVKDFKLREWSIQAVSDIHQIMFGGRDNLTVEERRVFIRLFYQNLSRKMLIETKANSYNASCKDRIDRGAATDAEDFAYLAILAQAMNFAHVIAFFKALVFARAIIVRKRTIIEERLERLIETVKFMLEHQMELRKLHDLLFPNIEISVDQFTDLQARSRQKEEVLVN